MNEEQKFKAKVKAYLYKFREEQEKKAKAPKEFVWVYEGNTAKKVPIEDVQLSLFDI